MTNQFFEGAEKLLEIWFGTTSYETQNLLPQNDLRNIPRDLIEEVLNLVNCKILKYARSIAIDSYVLSESSLFVMRTHLVFKTCGETTLLYAIQPLVNLARDCCGFDIVDQIYYSHRKFLRPELQKGPHTNFENEVAYLNTLFDGGCPYILGRTNSDCWYLYALDKSSCAPAKSDQTLGMMMTHLDPDIMKIFGENKTCSAAEITKKMSIEKLFDNATICDYLFDPCGYSMNGLQSDDYYFTIHVTPEPAFSYVSFETNAPYDQYHELIQKMITMFKPGNFITTIFSKLSGCSYSFDTSRKLFLFSDYARTDHQVVCVSEFDIIYSCYKKH